MIQKRHNFIGGGGTHHLLPPVDLSYSKCGRCCPWCVDGACALDLGAATPQAMVGSKAAGHMVCWKQGLSPDTRL